ncbi:MAG: hypothetical protein GX963_13420 [Bacteroidales bacterium]|nr:hypothetical protein [Bacteroidales bacterium]
MMIDRKVVAEKALQEQYGEEFVAYHTWDHGGDSFRASMYPKSDENIKFNAHIFNKGGIVNDYYAEKIVGKQTYMIKQTIKNAPFMIAFEALMMMEMKFGLEICYFEDFEEWDYMSTYLSTINKDLHISEFIFYYGFWQLLSFR